ncbi:MAG: hypothetical protein F6K56_05545 [Moorea sp. SIO3G5]|nr:hypothetical protein [Moorena sp. SIO3G5]
MFKTIQIPNYLVLITAFFIMMRYTGFFPCSLFPVPCSLLRSPCSLFL